jgi:hypothetical protein
LRNRPVDIIMVVYGPAIAHAVSRLGGPGSCPVQSMWDLWHTKWQLGQVFLCPHHSSVAPYSYAELTTAALVARVERLCLTLST